MNFRKNSMHPKYTFFSLNFTPFGYINFVLTYPDNILTHLCNPSLLAPKFPRKAATCALVPQTEREVCLHEVSSHRSFHIAWMKPKFQLLINHSTQKCENHNQIIDLLMVRMEECQFFLSSLAAFYFTVQLYHYR